MNLSLLRTPRRDAYRFEDRNHNRRPVEKWVEYPSHQHGITVGDPVVRIDLTAMLGFNVAFCRIECLEPCAVLCLQFQPHVIVRRQNAMHTNDVLSKQYVRPVARLTKLNVVAVCQRAREMLGGHVNAQRSQPVHALIQPNDLIGIRRFVQPLAQPSSLDGLQSPAFLLIELRGSGQQLIGQIAIHDDTPHDDVSIIRTTRGAVPIGPVGRDL